MNIRANYLSNALITNDNSLSNNNKLYTYMISFYSDESKACVHVDITYRVIKVSVHGWTIDPFVSSFRLTIHPSLSGICIETNIYGMLQCITSADVIYT